MSGTAVPVALMLLVFIEVAMSQNPQWEEQQQLDRIVREVMTCANIPALSLAFTSPDKRVTYARGFGSHQDRKDVSSQSVFCIGGATQAFTAVLLAKLLDTHPNVTWDTPIRDIVNHDIDLPYQYLSNNLNLKDIFAMRSGLAGMEIVPVVKPFNADELVRKLRYAPPVAGFREKTIYNEVLFALLEEVVQVLGGDTWQNLTRKHILQPLQMTSTTFIGPASQGSRDLVKGSIHYNEQPVNLETGIYSGLELVAPAVSVCTSADDILRWFNFILNDGRIGNRVVVDKAALEATYETVQPRGKNDDPILQNFRQINPPSIYSRHGTALGWINGFYRGYPFVSQDGSIPGYQTLATIVPSLKVGVYVAFNGDHDDKRVAAKVLLNALGVDFFIRDKPLPTSTEICNAISRVADIGARQRQDRKQMTPQRTSGPVARPLEDFVGTYRNFAYGDVEVKTTHQSGAVSTMKTTHQSGAVSTMKTTANEKNQNSGLVLSYGLAEYILERTNKNNTFQLIESGSLWYSTNGDWYRSNQEIFAEFFSDSQEQDERFTSIRIDGFDRHYTPEFSTNAQPPQYDRYSDKYTCSAPVLAAWQWTALLVITIMHFS